tara:strand:- start:111 stop:287 length:177 start_codon:yes stop_codon:yes gene_type:complete
MGEAFGSRKMAEALSALFSALFRLDAFRADQGGFRLRAGLDEKDGIDGQSGNHDAAGR